MLFIWNRVNCAENDGQQKKRKNYVAPFFTIVLHQPHTDFMPKSKTAPKPAAKPERLSVQLTGKQHAFLTKQSEVSGSSLSELIRQAVTTVMELNTPKK
jgi:hypothetical protein